MQTELALPSRYIALSTPAAEPFDYSALKPGEAEQLRQVAGQIRGLQNKLGGHIISIGELLLAVKQGLGHGNFGPWLASEFGWSERAARNYMQAAEVFAAKSATVAVLPPTTIYALASPSTPEPVRAAVVERLERGEAIPVDAIRDMLIDARAAVKRERDFAKLPKARQKAIRRDEAERAQRQQAWDEEQKRRGTARTAAMALIVEKVGEAMPELLRLLKAAEFGIYASDFEATKASAEAA